MKYDLIVIGAGAAGLNIAVFANRIGLKTLMIDKEDKKIGGDCLNYGCVPSKALIHIAKIAHDAKLSKAIGLKVSGKPDAKAITDYISSKVEFIRKHENAEHFRKQGLDVQLGLAKFVSPNSIQVNNQIHSAKKIIIATGSKPRSLNAEGIEKVQHYNNESVFNLKKIPNKLLVIGGGPIGIEISQALSRLGSQVTVVVSDKTFLPKESPEIAKILQNELEKEGIKFIFNARTTKFTSARSAIVQDKVTKKEQRVIFDATFIAIGRELVYPSGLEKANIQRDKDKKLIVNDYLQTTNPNIYISGDAAGGMQFTHATELHASVILNNLFSPFKKKLSYDNFAWVTYTDPEIATFGLNERQLKERNIFFEKLSENFAETDRAITDNSKGKLILLIDKSEKILGGSLVAPNAGEIIQELVLANSAGLTTKDIFKKIYPYPIASRVNKAIISKHLGKKLTPFTMKLMRWLFG